MNDSRREFFFDMRITPFPFTNGNSSQYNITQVGRRGKEQWGPIQV
jgi:hypothetical protein